MTSPWFEELDYHDTSMGPLVLQRRRVAALGDVDAYEVKLGEEYLMSSLFHEAEDELARMGLSNLQGKGWDVVVGGLGLGYTAAEALRRPEVNHLVVVEALEPVIGWHRRGLIPNGTHLSADPRCRLRHGDFFAMAREEGFDPDVPGRRFDAVLLDVDHSPRHTLSPAHDDFYTEAGLRRFKRFLKPGGVFGLWSNDPPDAGFLVVLEQVFDEARGVEVPFQNPLTGDPAQNSVYLAS